MSLCSVCGKSLDYGSHHNDFRLELRVVYPPLTGAVNFIEVGKPDGLDVDLCGVACLKQFAESYRYREK